MRIFRCDRCGSVAPFSAQRCPACDAPLGYVAEQRTIRILEATADPTAYRVEGHDEPVWRCLNSAWGCNWTLPAGSDTHWCRSCRLTRGRPDDARPDAIDAWTAAEAAKRRLINQLDELALPIEARSDRAPEGLAFDLVHLPGEGGITGHLDGVVTLDLAETDDHHRDDLRRRLGEPFRTVMGHLRHEIGHHYWARLVGRTDRLDRFRQLFGDDRIDYAQAVERHYAGGSGQWDPSRFASPYAAAHPLEDWAETFAHYLHVIDVVDTAVAHGVLSTAGAADLTTGAVGALEFDVVLDAWRPINDAANAIAESLGSPAVYPFDPSGLVVDKLAFVHRRIATHTDREPSDACH
jgi:hypothetical protein